MTTDLTDNAGRDHTAKIVSVDSGLARRQP